MCSVVCLCLCPWPMSSVEVGELKSEMAFTSNDNTFDGLHVLFLFEKS